MLNRFSLFHTSSSLLQRPDHALYGSVNWGLVSTGSYAIVDPADPHAVLYLSEKEYKVLLRVVLSNDQTLIVLARPGDTKVDDASKVKTNSPPGGGPKARSTTSNSSFPASSAVDPASPYSTKPPGQSASFWSHFYNCFGADIGANRLLNPTLQNMKQAVNLWARTLYGWSGGQLSSVGFYQDSAQVASYFWHLLKHEGPANLCKRMKISLFILNTYLSGKPIDDSRHLGVAISIRHGLPRWLPLRARASIRAGDSRAIRIWASILGMYKGFDTPHPPVSLDTIRNKPYEVTEKTQRFFTFLRTAFIPWLRQNGWVPPFQGNSDHPYMSIKAGPNKGKSILGIGLDVLAWKRFGDAPLIRYLLASGHTLALQYYQLCQGLVIGEMRFTDSQGQARVSQGPYNFNTDQEVFLGRLSVKEEAAGKNRIFALGDWFTQYALKPLHDWLFRILPNLPGDGTMNQGAALQGVLGHTHYWCYDISSATDNIPRVLYTKLLECLLGPELAQAWEQLLVDREFVLLDPDSKDRTVQQRVRYGRGQPMGFLSSWAMLDFVHHAIVQYSAWRVGKFPFFTYSITGDDSVIAKCQVVAKEYLIVMRELEIPISVAKSYTSERAMVQYISRTVRSGVDLSPASFREELAVQGMADRIAFAIRLAQRGWVDLTSSKWLTSLARLTLAFNENTYYSYVLGPKGRMGWKVDVAVSAFLGPGSPLYREPGFQGTAYIGFLLHWLGVGDALSKGHISTWNCHVPTNLDFTMKLTKLYTNCLKSFQEKILVLRRTLESSLDDFESKLLMDFTGGQKWTDPTQIVILLDWLEYYRGKVTEYTNAISRLRARYTTCTGTMVLGAAHDIPDYHRNNVNQIRRQLTEWSDNYGNKYSSRVVEIFMRLIQQQLVLTHLLPMPKVSDFDPTLPPKRELFTRDVHDWIASAVQAGFLVPLSEEYGRLSLKGVLGLRSCQRKADVVALRQRQEIDFMSGRGLRLLKPMKPKVSFKEHPILGGLPGS